MTEHEEGQELDIAAVLSELADLRRRISVRQDLPTEATLASVLDELAVGNPVVAKKPLRWTDDRRYKAGDLIDFGDDLRDPEQRGRILRLLNDHHFTTRAQYDAERETTAALNSYRDRGIEGLEEFINHSVGELRQLELEAIELRREANLAAARVMDKREMVNRCWAEMARMLSGAEPEWFGKG